MCGTGEMTRLPQGISAGEGWFTGNGSCGRTLYLSILHTHIYYSKVMKLVKNMTKGRWIFGSGA